MKKLLLTLLALASLGAPALAVSPMFVGDSTHEMGIDSNSNMFFRDPSTGPVTLSNLTVPATWITKSAAGLIFNASLAKWTEVFYANNN